VLLGESEVSAVGILNKISGEGRMMNVPEIHAEKRNINLQLAKEHGMQQPRMRGTGCYVVCVMLWTAAIAVIRVIETW